MIIKQSIISIATIVIAIYGNEYVSASGILGTPILDDKEVFAKAPILSQAALSKSQGILNKPEYQFSVPIKPTEPVTIPTLPIDKVSTPEKTKKAVDKNVPQPNIPLIIIPESSSDSSGSSSAAGIVTVGDRYSHGSTLMDNDISGSMINSETKVTEKKFTEKKVDTPTPTVTEKAEETSKGEVNAPVTTLSPEQVEEAIEIKKQLAIKNAALRSQEISGESDSSFVMLTAISAFAGIVAIAAVAMYVKKNINDTKDDSSQESSNTGPSENKQETERSSVYDDPLQTRFSSIVMITPNGDGVCIL